MSLVSPRILSGVANTIKNSPNSIGYVELDYAHTKGIPIALVKNPMGNFIEPSLDSTQEAVSNAVALNSLPADDKSWTKVSMLKAPGPKSYPIASFSYLLLFKDMSGNSSIDQTKAKAFIVFTYKICQRSNGGKKTLPIRLL